MYVNIRHAWLINTDSMETDRIMYLDTNSIIACHSTEIASEWEIKSPPEETAGLDSSLLYSTQ